MSPPIRLEVGEDILWGNMPLSEFLNHTAVQATLRAQIYKVFVLQGEEFKPVDNKHAFHQAVRDFHQAITAAGGQTVLFATWEFSWRPFLEDLAASYEQIGAELRIPVIPVGRIYKDCDETPFDESLTPYWLTAQDLHQTCQGTAVNAYAVFSLLTGRDPDGTNFSAPGNINDDSIMQYFSKMAWARMAV